MSDENALETPMEPTFTQAVRSNAHYLLDCYDELMEADAKAIANKLNDCADKIEQLEAEIQRIRSELACHRESVVDLTIRYQKMAERLSMANTENKQLREKYEPPEPLVTY